MPHRFAPLRHGLIFFAQHPKPAVEIPPFTPLYHHKVGGRGSFDDLICVDPSIIEPVEITIAYFHPDSRDPFRTHFLTRQLSDHMLSVLQRQFDEISRPEIPEPIHQDKN